MTSGGCGQQGGDLLGGEGAGGAFGEGAELEGAFADAAEEDDLGTDGEEHAADLAAAAFANRDRELELIVGYETAQAQGSAQCAVDLDTAAQGGELVFGDRHLEAEPVLFFDLVAGMRQGEGEVAVVGEEEEPRGVAVEAAYGVKAGDARRGGDEVEYGAAPEIVAFRGDEAGRFVEQEIGSGGVGDGDRRAVERQVTGFVRLRGVRGHLSGDGDAAFADGGEGLAAGEAGGVDDGS